VSCPCPCPFPTHAQPVVSSRGCRTSSAARQLAGS
jgi:hypothetical protein